MLEAERESGQQAAAAVAVIAVRQQGSVSGNNRALGCRALSTDSLVAALGGKLGVTVAPSQVGMHVVNCTML
jgi:hypothetical protein